MLVKRELIALAIEAAYNVDENPGAADAILVEDVGFSFEGSRMIERNPIKGAFGKEKSIFAGTLAQVTFTAEIKGSGTAGTAPEIGQALRACGLAETIVASTSVTYEPASESLESATIYYYQDGKRQKITGARGTVEISATVGEVAKASFTFTGHHAEDADAAIITGTFDDLAPPPMIAVPFTIGGYSAEISALNFALNNEVTTPASLSASDGYGEVRISDRDCSGTFDPLMTLIADQDWVADWQAGTERNLTTGVIGTVAGNRFNLTVPAASYRELGQGDRDGSRTYDIGFGANGEDAAFDLAFT
ncbi:MAG: hypothetical protein GY818_07070 [Planctomycetaceae bacterium]|nr:hypothetical protein [Planctomycetaceae bacterium]